jgi:hypothetical protein
MFAQGGGRFDVIIVKRHNAVYVSGAGQIADGVEDVQSCGQVGHEVNLVNAFSRPGFIGQLVACEEDDVGAVLPGRL